MRSKVLAIAVAVCGFGAGGAAAGVAIASTSNSSTNYYECGTSPYYEECTTTTSTTTTTTKPPPHKQKKPSVRVLKHSGLVKADRLGVALHCSGATCRGTLKVSTKVVVAVRHHKKTLHRRRTVGLGSAGYSLGAGRTRTFNVRINTAGRRLLASAKKHRLGATIVATLRGGRQASRHETIYTVTKKKH